jgi:bacillithiol synthase
LLHTKLSHKKLPSHALHYLRNLIHPHHQLQERVLNWFTFQSTTSENMIETLLKMDDSDKPGHYYGFLS